MKHKEFEPYMKKWMKTRELELSEDFLQETDEVLADLMKRIDREEEELFPRLKSAGV